MSVGPRARTCLIALHCISSQQACLSRWQRLVQACCSMSDTHCQLAPHWMRAHFRAKFCLLVCSGACCALGCSVCSADQGRSCYASNRCCHISLKIRFAAALPILQ